MPLNIDFPVATTNWGTVQHVKLYDSDGHELMYFDVDNTAPVNVGDTLNFNVPNVCDESPDNAWDLHCGYHDYAGENQMTSSVSWYGTCTNGYAVAGGGGGGGYMPAHNSKEDEMIWDRSLGVCALCGAKLVSRKTIDIKCKKGWKQVTIKTFVCGTKVVIRTDGTAKVLVGKKCLRFK